MKKKKKILHKLVFQIGPPPSSEDFYPLKNVYTHAYSKDQALATTCKKYNLDLRSRPWPKLQEVWSYPEGSKSEPVKLY